MFELDYVDRVHDGLTFSCLKREREGGWVQLPEDPSLYLCRVNYTLRFLQTYNLQDQQGGHSLRESALWSEG
jgi:hypothetical protein